LGNGYYKGNHLIIVVFGVSSFLESYVANILTEKGYDVILYDNRKSQFLNKKQSMVVGDIPDYATLLKTLEM